MVAADSSKAGAYMRGEPTPAAAARYARGVIWEPFVLALFLGLVISAGLYFAYLWPQVEPAEVEVEVEADAESEAYRPRSPEPPGSES